MTPVMRTKLCLSLAMFSCVGGIYYGVQKIKGVSSYSPTESPAPVAQPALPIEVLPIQGPLPLQGPPQPPLETQVLALPMPMSIPGKVAKPEYAISPEAPIQKSKRPSEKTLRSLPLNRLVKVHRSVYLFEGQIICGATPCLEATVTVHVSSGRRTKVRHAKVRVDGRYAVRVPVDAAINTGVDWRVDANARDYVSTETMGRHITTIDDKDGNLLTFQADLFLLPQ